MGGVKATPSHKVSSNLHTAKHIHVDLETRSNMSRSFVAKTPGTAKSVMHKGGLGSSRKS